MLDRADVRRQTQITVVLQLVTPWSGHDRGRWIYVAQADLDACGNQAKTRNQRWKALVHGKAGCQLPLSASYTRPMGRPQPTIESSFVDEVLVHG